MTTESAVSTPSISIEHIHSTLLTEIEDLMERSKIAPTADHSMILDFQAQALTSIFLKLVTPALNPNQLNAFEAIKLLGQLSDAATTQEESIFIEACA